VYHHRLHRWLLPGGHVEASDFTLAEAARREAVEETAVTLASGNSGRLVGMDVHGIPAHKGDPFHLHHDLIFALDAESSEVACTEEAPQVAWCRIEESGRYDLPASILRAFRRASPC
jgi:8-oxo-dGTP pyrophosphatase MutT (NUDIX family)